jgi:hypothetical protein
MYDFYREQLINKGYPDFLIKYLECPSLLRLRKVGYFCGMDYASKDIYDFDEYISRYDHSINVALLTWTFTKDKKATLAGLFHDVATPCFAHVIDYMNNDYATQESTEEYTEEIIQNDQYLLKCLQTDGIKVEDIIDFKKYSIVDNNRPKLCADRLDGVILTGLFWTKNITKKDVVNILSHVITFRNEDGELELGFNDLDTAKKVTEVSDSIDVYCHSNEDNYMMQLLANMTKYLIDNNYIKYEDLYRLNEEDIHRFFSLIDDEEFRHQYLLFKTIKKEDVPYQSLPNVKKRELRLLVNGKRI